MLHMHPNQNGYHKNNKKSGKNVREDVEKEEHL